MNARVSVLDLDQPATEIPAALSPVQAAEPAPLVLRDIYKRWGRKGPEVLRGVDLTLAPGSATWIGGSNGVGKTTLLRIAAGLIDPDRGTVESWGLSPRRSRARYSQLVAFLSAGDRGLYARLTVRRHLDFWARIAMLPRAELRPAVEDALDRFNLRALEDRRVDRMSMGQRQRLRLAMTFLHRPEIVLLDEPRNSLDMEGIEILRSAINDVLTADGVVVWCSPAGDPLDIEFDAHYVVENGELRPA